VGCGTADTVEAFSIRCIACSIAVTTILRANCWSAAYTGHERYFHDLTHYRPSMDIHYVDQCNLDPVGFAKKLVTLKRYTIPCCTIEIAFCQKVVRNILDGS
jgi:hypothetical protein